MQIGLALINLDRDEARLAHMRAEFARVGIEVERFPAILGLAVPDWLRPRFLRPDGQPNSSLKPGEIGVYASHLSLHRQLLERSDLDALVIMEDDLRLSDDLPRVLADLSRLAVPFDVIRLSNPAKAPVITHGAVGEGRQLVTYSRVPNNMGCYLISRAGAGKTTAFRGPVRFAIDEEMGRPWDWGLETFGVLPAPVEANIFEHSSIDQLGARALGRESWWDKLQRRNLGSPGAWLRQMRWQVSHLGASGYAKCLVLTALRSARKVVDHSERNRPPANFSGKTYL
jgi:glycosyl transferase family 25